MVCYKIEILKSVNHEVRKLDEKWIGKIVKTIHSLSIEPFPSGCVKLKGSVSGYRIRIGDYRLLYDVNRENKVVTVFSVSHRKNAYRKK